MQAWVAAGIFPQFANANSGPSCGTANNPGNLPESYAAAAFDINDNIAGFSSRGPSPWGQDIIKPNIAAPGVAVRSSWNNGDYVSISGSSMASPHVAGAVALMWSAAVALERDIDATKALLDMTAIDTEDLQCGGTAENNNVWGEGRLDAFAAVDESPRGPTGILTGTVLALSRAAGEAAPILLVGAAIAGLVIAVREAWQRFEVFRTVVRAVAGFLSDPLLTEMLFCPLMYYGSAREDDMDLAQFYEADLAFHRKIWNLSDNPYLADALERVVVPLFAFFLMKTSRRRNSYVESASMHASIVEALPQKSAAELREMVNHLSDDQIVEMRIAPEDWGG